MAGSEAMRSLRWLTRSAASAFNKPETVMRQAAARSSRHLATSTEPSTETVSPAADADISTLPTATTAWSPPSPVLVTLYAFPSMKPLRFEKYPAEHLQVPLRRDLLHRAVIYEGDNTRQGTASTKWRDDVHGSGRKLAPQKGTGNARVGDRKSPIRRGGGVAFGPHPRDFSTDLPRKIYDKAWRTALSYRYNCGHIMVVDRIQMPRDASPWFWKTFFEANPWGKGKGRCTLITDEMDKELFRAVNEVEEHARILDRPDVDVKDLLKTGKLIIEKKALDKILREHSKDLVKAAPRANYPRRLYFSE
ncbi:50S ribosomal protein L4 [Talaromyces proteolyticus]|uniref:Large ribosomal subunit protein uL4m n=1 Tax=Talaromyces proteolyticus TaxID=1131652 RepID=A0AAD4L3U0_9EURO|nr:50S ribosomal protein L4 [Talaromyces proteolyticus]KAH8705398.1 50S ribosomal protein L4 [Talaromyces proteolyticus]